ncbi:MAG: MOSC domain-containing protein [Gemmatimonadales bacterium]|nr:MOSC domain-containing protein [Gemmatimonadales bacterium]MBP6572011.1 MOSC domain-containing protein [Gemmatimonadales bacterium]MBP7620580.1 MOSC domain-containing protein [Gemmatimonadales bacterium]
MPGCIEALWSKRAHRGPMDPQAEATLVPNQGMAGSVGRSKRRQVTILSCEAWDAATSELGAAVDPSMRRANILVSGLDLYDTRGKVLRIGSCRLIIGGELTPCERMDEASLGLQAALTPRWRGGVFAQVEEGGVVRVGDAVEWEDASFSAAHVNARR